MKRAFLLACALFAALYSLDASAENVTVDISTADHAYNRFTFLSPYKTVILPPDVSLASEPVSLGDNTTLLLDFKDDTTRPVQMVVQMINGGVFDFTLRPGAPGKATWNQPGGPESRSPVERPNDRALVGLFRSVIQNPDEPPETFAKSPTPNSGRVDDLIADYTAAYRGKRFMIYVMRLRSDHPSPILPQDLYVDGVKAVYIDGDAVGPNLAPMAVVLMARDKREGS